MSTSYIICRRHGYAPQSTLGKIALTNDEYRDKFFSHSLEDTVRAIGIKVKKHTAICENLLGYKVRKTWSNRFKRFTLQLFTEDKDLSLKAGGIYFTGVRNHGGNTHKNTEGCPLTAYNLAGQDVNGDYRIQGRSDLDLMDWYDAEIAKGNEVRWVVINLKQEN
jgi:hypothetical protein